MLIAPIAPKRSMCSGSGAIFPSTTNVIPKKKVEAFLPHLTVNENISASTQNQALCPDIPITIGMSQTTPDIGFTTLLGVFENLN